MRNRLSCCLTHVHADVEAVRRMTPRDLIAGCLDRTGERLLFRSGRIEPTRHVTTSHQKCVTRSYRKCVPETNDHLSLQKDTCRIRIAERTLRLLHVNSLCACEAFSLELALEPDGPALWTPPARHPPLRES